MSELSPDARAVFYAWIHPARFPISEANKHSREGIAAALRTAADRALVLVPAGRVDQYDLGVEHTAEFLQRIADELENCE